MNTALNRNQFVQSVAPVLRQLLSGFALVAAVRENLYAATSDEAKGSRRASLAAGLLPNVPTILVIPSGCLNSRRHESQPVSGGPATSALAPRWKFA